MAAFCTFERNTGRFEWTLAPSFWQQGSDQICLGMARSLCCTMMIQYQYTISGHVAGSFTAKSDI